VSYYFVLEILLVISMLLAPTFYYYDVQYMNKKVAQLFSRWQIMKDLIYSNNIPLHQLTYYTSRTSTKYQYCDNRPVYL